MVVQPEHEEEMVLDQQKSAFALLIFGELGKSASISLQSIVQTSKLRICVAGDSAGLNWAFRQLPKSEQHRLCSHTLPIKDLEALDIDNSQNHSYSHFGQERFIKLTTFKWYLLHSVLTQHEHLNIVIFSDLDVLWLGPPTQELDDYSVRDLLALVQDDTPFGVTYKHFCTGIMFWFNTAESILALAELYDLQFSQNKTCELIPDEPIFNRWYESRSQVNAISALPTESFVIGHKFFKCMISNLQTIQVVTAFHANYVVGEKAKYRRLRAIELRNIGNNSWSLLVLVEFARLLYSQLFRQSR